MKFHLVHHESDSHWEEEFENEDAFWDTHPHGDINIFTPEECPECKRGVELDGQE